MKKTTVIAIEGIDGSGKSVQYARLEEALKARNFTVAKLEYPMYSTFFGAEVGRYLSGSGGVRADAVDGKSMALWYALDRWESLKDYRDGESDFLIINRYVLSNAVYQSIRDIDEGKPDIDEWVFELEYGHFGLPRADVFIYYDVAPASAGENVKKKGFREYVGDGADVYEASSAIQRRAREKYLECAAKRGDIVVIQCMGEHGLRSIDDIAHETLVKLAARGII